MKLDGGNTFRQATNLGMLRHNTFTSFKEKLRDDEGADWFKFRTRSSDALVSFSLSGKSDGSATINYDIGVYAKSGNGAIRLTPFNTFDFGGVGRDTFLIPKNGVYYLKIESPRANDREVDYTVKLGVGSSSWLLNNQFPSIGKR